MPVKKIPESYSVECTVVENGRKFKLDNCYQDEIMQAMPHRAFVLTDGRRIEVPIMGVKFEYSPERGVIADHRAEERATAEAAKKAAEAEALKSAADPADKEPNSQGDQAP